MMAADQNVLVRPSLAGQLRRHIPGWRSVEASLDIDMHRLAGSSSPRQTSAHLARDRHGRQRVFLDARLAPVAHIVILDTATLLAINDDGCCRA